MNDAPELFRNVQKLLGDAVALDAMDSQGLQFVVAHRGATDSAMAVIEQTLDPRVSR